MRLQWLGSLLLASACLNSSLAQQSKSRVPVRDPIALGILQQATGAAGGLPAIDMFQSFSATGRITVYRTEEGTEGEVSVKGRGLQEIRVDAHLDGIDEWWFIGKSGGFRKEAGGTVRPLNYQEVINIRSFCPPWPQVARAIRDSLMEVTSLGATKLNGRPAFGVRIRDTRIPVGQVNVGGKLLEKDFYIDGQTFQVIAVEDVSYPMDKIAGGISRRVTFSDYRVVNGTPFPFSISEQVGHHRRLMAIHLVEVSINVPLSDHDFAP